MLNQPRNRQVAAILAFASAANPFHIACLHKFYLKQYFWGIVYLLLIATPIPRIASVLEGLWYLSQDPDEFDLKFNGGAPSELKSATTADVVDPQRVSAVAEAVRQLDQLRTDGLISEYEFEQKRRQLLDRIA